MESTCLEVIFSPHFPEPETIEKFPYSQERQTKIKHLFYPFLCEKPSEPRSVWKFLETAGTHRGCQPRYSDLDGKYPIFLSAGLKAVRPSNAENRFNCCFLTSQLAAWLCCILPFLKSRAARNSLLPICSGISPH